MATTVVEERESVLVKAGVLTNISSIISYVLALQTSDVRVQLVPDQKRR